MYLDFERFIAEDTKIVLYPTDDAFGPYGFDCSPALPSTLTITDATATAYLYSAGTFIEYSNLVEPGSVTLTGDTTLQLKLQAVDLPVGEYYLKLTLTLSNGGTKNLLAGEISVNYF